MNFFASVAATDVSRPGHEPSPYLETRISFKPITSRRSWLAFFFPRIPKTNQNRLKEWSDQYGKIYSMKIGKGTVIVLNDRRAVHELIDKKSAIYSERAFDHNADVALGQENFAFMHTTPLWRAQRKIASQFLAPQNLDTKIAPIQEAE
jgi:cytochrome P450